MITYSEFLLNLSCISCDYVPFASKQLVKGYKAVKIVTFFRTPKDLAGYCAGVQRSYKTFTKQVLTGGAYLMHFPAKIQAPLA
jgi:hypothetical protein